MNYKDVLEYLEQRGWVIKDGSAYRQNDVEFKIPYNIEGTYELYQKEIYKE